MNNRTITIHSDLSMHTLCLVPTNEIPVACEHRESYTKFYEVRNFDANGVTFMYLGIGKGQIVAWYANTFAFWSSFGTTLKNAVEGAQRDGWMYA